NPDLGLYFNPEKRRRTQSNGKKYTLSSDADGGPAAWQTGPPSATGSGGDHDPVHSCFLSQRQYPERSPTPCNAAPSPGVRRTALRQSTPACGQLWRRENDCLRGRQPLGRAVARRRCAATRGTLTQTATVCK